MHLCRTRLKDDAHLGKCATTINHVVRQRANACGARGDHHHTPVAQIPRSRSFSSILPCNNSYSTIRLLERHDHTNEHDRPDRAYRSRAPKQARPMRARLMDDAQHTHPVVALWSSTRTLYVARWRCDARARLACATRLRAHNIPNRAYAPLPHAQQPKMRRICLITSRLISGRAYFGSANVLYD